MPKPFSNDPALAQGEHTGSPHSTIDFVKTLFAHTTEAVYVCSFPNERYDESQPGERHLLTREGGQIMGFLKKWDRRGRGTFVCMSTIDGEKRNKDTAREIITLFADLDFKTIDGLPGDPAEARAEVLRQIKRLRHQPSIIVFSGGGVHLYWLLKEPFSSQDERDRIEDALRQLADIVAGDLPVCEVARVLRLPGSHNTKNDAFTPVEIIELHAERRYDLDDLEEWFSEQSPIMLRKERERAQTVGEMGELDFFAQYAKQHGIKGPIDVEARLAGMMFMGSEDSSIHQTQLAVTAALLNRGMPQHDVVAVVLEATRKAAGAYGARWNWRREERKIVNMCDTWIKKNPPETRKVKEYQASIERRQRTSELQSIVAAPAAAHDKPKPQLEIIDGGKAVAAGVVSASVPRSAIASNDAPHIELGRAVLAAFAAGDEELINIKGGSWFYSGGVWEMHVDEQWLIVRIEDACARLGFKSNTKLRNECKNWIKARPELWRKADSIPWDAHGKIPTRSGLIDPLTGILEAARPDHYCTWRFEVDYDPAATCPWWEIMIADMFGDRDEAEQLDLVGVVQELIGAALIDKKPRGLSKACVFWGNENRAKSGVLDVVAGLSGKNPITAPLGSVDGAHGLMPFTRRAPWVLHEAFNGQWHMSQTVKAVVTGDPIQINIKNGPVMQMVAKAPIFWATNFQPQFKEATKAIVSRMIVIEVTRKFDEHNPIGAAAEAIRHGFSKPGEFIVATELAGVLNWAMAGLARALKRGSIARTKSIEEAAKAIHHDSNLVAGFLEDCIEYDPNARLRTADFCLAHSAWWLELKGEDRRLPTNEAIGKNLKAMGDDRIGMNRKEMRTPDARYYCGIALNKRGLMYHRKAYESALFEGKTITATPPQQEVNRLIPPDWDNKKSVIAMRRHHKPEGTREEPEDE